MQGWGRAPCILVVMIAARVHDDERGRRDKGVGVAVHAMKQEYGVRGVELPCTRRKRKKG